MNIHKLVNQLSSKANSNEKAIPIDVEYPWDSGAPIPNVFSNEHKTLLAYFIAENSDDFDTYGLIEFESCRIHKFGAPNDEVLNGHRLYRTGLEFYKAHIVENSTWISEIIQINSMHPRFNVKYYEDYKHYIFCFHDSTFECIAEGFKSELFKCSFGELVQNTIIQRLNQ